MVEGHLARRSRLVVDVAALLPPPDAATDCERFDLAPRDGVRDCRDGSGVCARVPTADARRVSAARTKHFTLERTVNKLGGSVLYSCTVLHEYVPTSSSRSVPMALSASSSSLKRASSSSSGAGVFE